MAKLNKDEAAFDALLEKYKHRLSKTRWLGMTVHAGWLPIVQRLLARVEAALAPSELEQFEWHQIKQKYGQLRAYYGLSDGSGPLHIDIQTPDAILHMTTGTQSQLSDKIDRIIAQVAEEASRTCEYCGQPGQVSERSDRWIHVACRTHREHRPWLDNP